MTDKNIYIKDGNGNKLYPVTKTSLIINDAGEPIGDVEAGAQVNRIEKIKVNGVELEIVSKEVDISVPNVPVYSLAKSETADSGYSATYQLTKDARLLVTKSISPKIWLCNPGRSRPWSQTTRLFKVIKLATNT